MWNARSALKGLWRSASRAASSSFSTRTSRAVGATFATLGLSTLASPFLHAASSSSKKEDSALQASPPEPYRAFTQDVDSIYRMHQFWGVRSGVSIVPFVKPSELQTNNPEDESAKEKSAHLNLTMSLSGFHQQTPSGFEVDARTVLFGGKHSLNGNYDPMNKSMHGQYCWKVIPDAVELNAEAVFLPQAGVEDTLEVSAAVTGNDWTGAASYNAKGQHGVNFTQKVSDTVQAGASLTYMLPAPKFEYKLRYKDTQTHYAEGLPPSEEGEIVTFAHDTTKGKMEGNYVYQGSSRLQLALGLEYSTLTHESNVQSGAQISGSDYRYQASISSNGTCSSHAVYGDNSVTYEFHAETSWLKNDTTILGVGVMFNVPLTHPDHMQQL